MSNVRITGMTVVEQEPNELGFRILAYFDCKVWGLRLRGCTMVAAPDGKLCISPPRIPGPAGERRAVHITDPHLRARMEAVALPAYRALGGSWEAVPRMGVGETDAGGRDE